MTGQLHEEQDKETTLDNLMEGFQLIGFDWRYLYVNDAVIKHSKYTKKELLGYTMMEKYPGIEKTTLFSVLTICMKERTSKSFVNEFTYPDQTIGWFELRIQPVPEGLFILSIDITERKRADEKRIEYIHGLEEILFVTSHKVRQPITQILGLSNLLEKDVHSPEDLKRITLYMKNSLRSLDQFTKDLTKLLNDLQDRVNN